MIKRALSLLALMLVLTSCATTGATPSGAHSAQDMFQLHTAPDGHVYRIDTRTGKTSWLDGGAFREVAEQTMPQLVVGKVYRAEDGKSTYRYSGEGRLEKWGLDRYVIPPDKPSR